MDDDDVFNELKRREQLARDGRWLMIGAIALFFIALLLLVIIGDQGTIRDPKIGFMGTLFSAALVIGIWGLTMLYRSAPPETKNMLESCKSGDPPVVAARTQMLWGAAMGALSAFFFPIGPLAAFFVAACMSWIEGLAFVFYGTFIGVCVTLGVFAVITLVGRW